MRDHILNSNPQTGGISYSRCRLTELGSEMYKSAIKPISDTGRWVSFPGATWQHNRTLDCTFHRFTIHICDASSITDLDLVTLPMSAILIGLYRENAIAIDIEASDSLDVGA